MNNSSWFGIDEAVQIDSPALCVYKDRVQENIDAMLKTVPASQVRPHVKTNKIAEVCRMMMDAGITKFKCATIAEAEMLGMIGAPDVLLAYPVVGPKADRLRRLIEKYPNTHYSCLVDSADGASGLAKIFSSANKPLDVFIDLNVGMGRTGILPANAPALYETIHGLPGLRLAGLHAYDGHIHDSDFELRKSKCLAAMLPADELKQQLEKETGYPISLVAGGSPSYLIHAQAGRECSPGTFIFWDKGYSDGLPEQPFRHAALLLCRIVSFPTDRTICVDLGHKSVAAEKPQPRVYFLNAPEADPISQSEEHLVLTVPDIRKYRIGQVLYGVPMHICPSVALYDEAVVVEDHRVTDHWPVIARRRKITI
ncbi:MAG TPA: D-TA family PLP-dependent enzyme [Puia sp.]|nr:D-TA family PLP-dependent enzyme [Puia sp.]